MIDRDIYFDSVRDSLFSGAMTQEQVDGQNVILALWDWQATGTPMKDRRWLAYMLATIYHECAKRMWPIEEYGQGQGHEYGEVDSETGQTYFGRGFVQLTWRENYANATKALSLTGDRDLEWHADRALDCLIAARVLFRGMAEGWFRNAKLGDYFNSGADDPVGARNIINADVSKNGQLIAGYHNLFLEAIEAAYVDALVPPVTEPVITMMMPRGVRLFVNGEEVAVAGL